MIDLVKLLPRLIALSKAERHALVGSFIVLLWVRLALTIVGYNRLIRFIRPAGGSAPPEILHRTGWAVHHAARLVPGASCLTQAIAAQVILKKSGFNSRLRVGVARGSAGKIRAHAWLISGDAIIIGGDAQSLAEYSVFADRLTPTA